MPNWFINCVAAQILHDRHGLFCPQLNNELPRFFGNYWYDFNANRLRRHSSLVRQPEYQLTVDDVLALLIIPKEARDAYIEASGTLIHSVSPSDS